MDPIFSRGDAVIYDKNDIDNIKIGDVIAFRQSGVVITHRIVKIGNNIIKTKGDANNGVDYFDVKPSDVLGKVEYRVKFIGYPTLWLNEFFKGER